MQKCRNKDTTTSLHYLVQLIIDSLANYGTYRIYLQEDVSLTKLPVGRLRNSRPGGRHLPWVKREDGRGSRGPGCRWDVLVRKFHCSAFVLMTHSVCSIVRVRASL